MEEPFQVSFSESLLISSYLLSFLPLELLLSDASCDMTFRSVTQGPSLPLLLILPRILILGKKIYYSSLSFSPLLLKAPAIIKKKAIIYLKLTGLCGTLAKLWTWFRFESNANAEWEIKESTDWNSTLLVNEYSKILNYA